jgi:hypothetical protein
MIRMTNKIPTTIYILKLENDKYYVGKSKDPKRRIEAHKKGTGSAWTSKYKVVKKMKEIPNRDGFDEDAWTLRMMATFGIENVRGGSYSMVTLDENTISGIKKCIYGAEDKCMLCGSSDHWVSKCKEARPKVAKKSVADNKRGRCSIM